MRLYHNPRCSKSREALRLLREAGCEPEVVEYLKSPLDRNALSGLLARLGLTPGQLARTSQAADLGISPATDEEWLEAMIEHPILMERPVAEVGDRAVVGRPPERVLELL